MALLSVFFRREQPRASLATVSRTQTRNELLSSAVRETLRTHGIPGSWVGAETLPAKTPSEPRGVHLRLVLKNTNPKLLAHVFALERTIRARLSQLDPHCADWLLGTSWRVDVPLGSDPTELPGADFWAPARLAKSRPGPAPLADRLSQSMVANDRAFARTTCEAPPEFSPTQPMRG